MRKMFVRMLVTMQPHPYKFLGERKLPRMVVNVHPLRGDGALGGQASCLLWSLKQAGCLLSQCLERLKSIARNDFSTRVGPDKNSDKTEAGPGATTRRIVAPKSGLVGMGREIPEKSDTEDYLLRAEGLAEPS